WSCTTTRPPRVAPFPYTTLFRSATAGLPGVVDAVQPRNVDQRLGPGLRRVAGRACRPGLRHRGDGAAADDVDHAAGARGAARGEDRKSTRLNSSHVKISYAVFCL